MSRADKKSYLGDGAFVQLGSYATEVVLTTENGECETNRVVLGPAEIDLLMRWLKRSGDWIYDDGLDDEPPPETSASGD